MPTGLFPKAPGSTQPLCRSALSKIAQVWQPSQRNSGYSLLAYTTDITFFREVFGMAFVPLGWQDLGLHRENGSGRG